MTVDVTGTWYGRACRTGTGTGPPATSCSSWSNRDQTVTGFLRVERVDSELRLDSRSTRVLSMAPWLAMCSASARRVAAVEGELTVSGDEMNGRRVTCRQLPNLSTPCRSILSPASPPR